MPGSDNFRTPTIVWHSGLIGIQAPDVIKALLRIVERELLARMSGLHRITYSFHPEKRTVSIGRDQDCLRLGKAVRDCGHKPMRIPHGMPNHPIGASSSFSTNMFQRNSYIVESSSGSRLTVPPFLIELTAPSESSVS